MKGKVMYFTNFSNEFIRFSKPLSYFETGPHILQAGLKLVMQLRMTWNIWSSCLHLLSIGIKAMCH